MKKGMIAVLSAIVGCAGGCLLGIEYMRKKPHKFQSYYNILLEWLAIKQEGKTIASYFHTHDYQRVAIYGMGELGVRLLKELELSDIEVVCAIDKGIPCEEVNVELKKPGEPVENIDVVVVTATFAFWEIQKSLQEYLKCPIISLEDVIFDQY